MATTRPTSDVTKSGENSSYDAAVKALYSPCHQATTPSALAESSARRTKTIRDMRLYMQRIGWSPSCLAQTKLIHITGTKGKGSVACFCDHLLRHHYRVSTGLFTSPHLIDIRERIRVNGKMVSRSVFAASYWKIRKKLEDAAVNISKENKADDDDNKGLPTLPGYFRMLTLMALDIFTSFDVPLDVIILEVGMGGRFDATNLLDADCFRCVVCGVTQIEYDHCRVLGNTLPEIAWEKGGIFLQHKLATITSPRPGTATTSSDIHCCCSQIKSCNEADCKEKVDSMANDYKATKDYVLSHDHDDHERMVPKHSDFDIPSFFTLHSNHPSVIKVLQHCAHFEGEKSRLAIIGGNPSSLSIFKIPFCKSHKVTDDTKCYCGDLIFQPAQLSTGVRVGLAGDHQIQNAELALAMCQAIMDDANIETKDIEAILAQVSCLGRCQTVIVSTTENVMLNVRLDGAHTIQSVAAGIRWFHEVSRGCQNNVLIFNCSHERNPIELLKLLVPSEFKLIIFASSDTERPSAVQKQSAKILLEDAGMTYDPALDTFEHAIWQNTLACIWRHLETECAHSGTNQPSGAKVISGVNAAEAITIIREAMPAQSLETLVMHNNEDKIFVKPRSVEIFVTGSIYLVGSVLNAVGWDENEP